MIKHYQGMLKKDVYNGKEDQVFMGDYSRPVLDLMAREIELNGPIIRLQVLTNPTKTSPMYFFKQNDFSPASKDGYIPFLVPLIDYVGQNCKILLEFED
ncbi:MAG: hypothetical protein U1C19_07870 [Methanobacteriaceae archaeon]|nr:hypothetical protein [Methanobacteriaceae archaeon]